MLTKREIQQRLLGCISASVLLHAGAGAAIIASGYGVSKSISEKPTAVYISENSVTDLPKGVQTETLPPAPQAQEAAPVEEQKPEQSLPKALPAKKPAKTLVTTLPVKKAKASRQEDSVKAALAESRAATPELETTTESEVATTTPEEIKPIEAAPEEPATEEIESASAMTAPSANEADEGQAAEEAPEAAPAPAPAPEPAPAQSNTQGAPGGTGDKAASADKFGIRDATELREGAGNRKPVYPDNDRLARNQGVAVFVARVLPDGTVTDIKVEKSTKSPTLNKSAMNAMKNWRFMPGQEGLVRKTFTFSLGGDAQEMPARLRR